MSALSKFRAIASKRKIVAITAWDFPSGLLAETANIDLVLVGDSLGMCTLGQKDTKSVTLEEMIHHTRAVRRAVNTSFIMADLPFGTYEVSAEQGILLSI
jgi:3-methyl-2-oxobutanoate hydroxymethyltransferase